MPSAAPAQAPQTVLRAAQRRPAPRRHLAGVLSRPCRQHRPPRPCRPPLVVCSHPTPEHTAVNIYAQTKKTLLTKTTRSMIKIKMVSIRYRMCGEAYYGLVVVMLPSVSHTWSTIGKFWQIPSTHKWHMYLEWCKYVNDSVFWTCIMVAIGRFEENK